LVFLKGIAPDVLVNFWTSGTQVFLSVFDRDLTRCGFLNLG
jgi:hypothetical protein